MAQFNVVGFEEVERQFLLRGENAIKAVPLMLEAGAKVLIAAQKEEAETLKISGRSKGALIASIKSTKIMGKGSAAYVEVYPHGTDRKHTKKGVRNAEKAFVLEYGRSGYTANPWMRRANEKSADAVTEAMREAWEKVTDGSG